MIKESRMGKNADDQDGPICNSNKNCPPCCRAQANEDMRDWLIKKQFLNKLYNDELKRNLDIQLGILWGRYIHTKEEEYDPYKIQKYEMWGQICRI